MRITRKSLKTAPRSRQTNQENGPQDHWSKLARSNYPSTVYENRVHVWVLPLGLSKERYGGRQGSAACALITVQMAHDFMTQNIPMPPTSSQDSQNLPQAVMDVLIDGIVDGNETHDKAMVARKNGFSGILSKKYLEEMPVVECGLTFHRLKKTQNEGFSILEAIQVQRPELHEVDHRDYSGPFIKNLVAALRMVVTSLYLCEVDRLPIVLDAYEMAMCVIYDRPTHSILLLDSHSHNDGRDGSVVCVASFEHINEFISAVTKYVFGRTKDFNGEFHITCLMLTNLMNKVHQGKIFLPVEPTTMRTPSTRPLKPRMKTMKIVCVGHVASDEDREYENSSK